MIQAATDPASQVGRLSAKERECLRMVARRLSSKEIAVELGIAKTSVDTYCDRARAKLGVADRFAAARVLEAEFGPAPRTPPKSQAPALGAPAGERSAHTARRTWVLAAVSAGVGCLAAVTLLAGLRALDRLKPAQYETAKSIQSLDATRGRGPHSGP